MKKLLGILVFHFLCGTLYGQDLVQEWRGFLQQNDPLFQRLFYEGQTEREAARDRVYASLWPSLTLTPSLNLSPRNLASEGLDWQVGASLSYSQVLPFVGSLTASVQPSGLFNRGTGISEVSFSSSLGIKQTFLPDFFLGFGQPTTYQKTREHLEKTEALRQMRFYFAAEKYVWRKLREYYFLSITTQQKILYQKLLNWYDRLEKDLEVRFQQGTLSAVELQEKLAGRRQVFAILESLFATLTSFGPELFPTPLLNREGLKDWLTRLESENQTFPGDHFFRLDEEITLRHAELSFLQSHLDWSNIGLSLATTFSLVASTGTLTTTDWSGAWEELWSQDLSRQWSWNVSLTIPLMPYDPAYRLATRRESRRNEYLAHRESLFLQWERARRLRTTRLTELNQELALKERLASLEGDRLELLKVRSTQGRATSLDVEYQEIQDLLAQLGAAQTRGSRFFFSILP